MCLLEGAFAQDKIMREVMLIEVRELSMFGIGRYALLTRQDIQVKPHEKRAGGESLRPFAG